MASARLLVNIDANSAKLVNEIQKSRKSIEGMKTSVDQVKTSFEKMKSFIDSMNSFLQAIKTNALVELGEKTLRAVRQIYQFVDTGAKVKATEESFESMSKTSGIAIDSLIKKLSVATNATVDDTDLMIKATKLMAEGFSAENIIAVGEAARVSARLTGTEVKTAYESMADAIVNLRERGLKTQGFVIDLDDAYEKQAKLLNINKDELTGYGKQMALLNAVIEKTKELQDGLNISTTSSYEKMQQQRASYQDIYEWVAKVASSDWERVTWGIEKFGKGVIGIGSAFKFAYDQWLKFGEKIGIISAPKSTQFDPKDQTQINQKLKDQVKTILPDIKQVTEMRGLISNMGWEDYAAGAELGSEETRKFNQELLKTQGPLEQLANSFKGLGIISEKEKIDAVNMALWYTENIKKMGAEGKATAQDLANAYNAVSEAMKKLPKTAEQVAKEMAGIETNKYDALEKLEEEYQANVKALADDPEKSKKVQKLIDDLMKVRKTIMDTAEKSKLELKITSDVEEARKNLDDLIKEYDGKTINLNIRTSEESIKYDIGGGWKTYTPPNLQPEPSWLDYVKGKTEFFQGGKDAVKDMGDSFQDLNDEWGGGINVPVMIFGIGSSKKLISDKIKEIIDEFGGLEKAASAIQANIEFVGASAEYTKLATKLKGIEVAFPGYSDLVQLTKSGWEIQQGLPYYMEQQAMIILDIKSMMEQMRLRMLGSQMQMGSYQTGTDYVPQTGLYKLHKGESVYPPGISVGDVIINVGGGGSTDATVDAIVKALKYKLSGKLSDALRKN